MSYPHKKKFQETPFDKCENCGRAKWRHSNEEMKNCQQARYNNA